MADVMENMDTPKGPTQQPGRISTIFQCYRENFWLFWRIMMPLIVFGFLFDFVLSLSDGFFDPENLWHFDTARGMSVGKHPKSTGIYWGMIFRFHTFSIGWLWLAMCPLAFAVVQYYRGVKVTAQRVWRTARGEALSILSASFLLWLLVLVGFFAFMFLTSGLIPDIPASPYGSSLCLGLCLIMIIVIYFGVNWSLYSQSIIIEHQVAIAAVRRSSELVRGVWGRAFRMYLLLALVTMVLTSVLLGLTLMVFSLTVPEFAPLREVLLSAKFFTLFFGGYARISFENAPNFWTIGVIVMVNTLVHAFLAPIWAILTTHLYLERIGE